MDRDFADRIVALCSGKQRDNGDYLLAAYFNIASYIENRSKCIEDYSARTATLVVIKMVQKGDTECALVALDLLDVLVKNCGYPIHLYISRRDFLRGLASCFPQTPPETYNPVQISILNSVNKWYQTVCQWSSYKSELAYIKNLYNMLMDSGYAFPAIDPNEISVLKPQCALKFLTEYHEDDEVIIVTKINELMRRGQEKDLEIVKKFEQKLNRIRLNPFVIAKKQFTQELEKLHRRFDIFNDFLNAICNDELSMNDDGNIGRIKQEISYIETIQWKIRSSLKEIEVDDNKENNREFIENTNNFYKITVKLMEKCYLTEKSEFKFALKINPFIQDIINGTEESNVVGRNINKCVDVETKRKVLSTIPSDDSSLDNSLEKPTVDNKTVNKTIENEEKENQLKKEEVKEEGTIEDDVIEEKVKSEETKEEEEVKDKVTKEEEEEQKNVTDNKDDLVTIGEIKNLQIEEAEYQDTKVERMNTESEESKESEQKDAYETNDKHKTAQLKIQEQAEIPVLNDFEENGIINSEVVANTNTPNCDQVKLGPTTKEDDKNMASSKKMSNISPTTSYNKFQFKSPGSLSSGRGGLMLRNLRAAAPVTVFATSTVESNGQFKYSSNIDKIEKK